MLGFLKLVAPVSSWKNFFRVSKSVWIWFLANKIKLPKQ